MRYGGGDGGGVGEYGACDWDSGGFPGGGADVWGFEDGECGVGCWVVDDLNGQTGGGRWVVVWCGID